MKKTLDSAEREFYNQNKKQNKNKKSFRAYNNNATEGQTQLKRSKQKYQKLWNANIYLSVLENKPTSRSECFKNSKKEKRKWFFS